MNNETKIDIVTTEAVKAFLDMVTKMYPEIKNNLTPYTHKIELQNKAYDFIKRWVEINTNKYKLGDEFTNGYKVDEIYNSTEYKYKCIDNHGIVHFCNEKVLDKLQLVKENSFEEKLIKHFEDNNIHPDAIIGGPLRKEESKPLEKKEEEPKMWNEKELKQRLWGIRTFYNQYKDTPYSKLREDFQEYFDKIVRENKQIEKEYQYNVTLLLCVNPSRDINEKEPETKRVEIKVMAKDVQTAIKKAKEQDQSSLSVWESWCERVE